MAKHTPGPWIHEATSEAQLIKSKQGYLVAEVAQDETYDYAADMREAEANAHLIASAPELLEALKACHLQMLQSNNSSEYAEGANRLAIAAIAKAESRP